MNQSKALAGSLAGALAALLIWGLSDGLGIVVPEEARIALGVVIGFAVVWIAPANRAPAP